MTAAVAAPAAARSPKASLAAARRKLNAAQAAVNDTDASIFDVRHAHVMVSGAAQLLQEHLDARVAANADAQRRTATALAKNLRDSRFRPMVCVPCATLRTGEVSLRSGPWF